MKLHVGERLIGRPNQPGGYVVTAVVRETPWGCLYTGKKIFANFDFAGKRPREADEKEWLDVYLRTLEYPFLEDPEYVAERRRLARHEMRRVLGNRATNLWPEPVDVLEVVNARDSFAGQSAEALRQEPVLVFARPQGDTLTQWRQRDPSPPRVLAVVAELLNFLDAIHRDGLLLAGLSPEGVLVDRADRVHYLSTDLVLEAGPVADLPGAARRGRFFPPERFPRGFAAPECFDPAAPLDARADLFAWAALTVFLLIGERPEHGAPAFRREHFAALEKVLRGIPPAQVRAWLELVGVPGALANWPRNLLTVVQLCLELSSKCRPESVEHLHRWLVAPPPPPVVAALAVRQPVGQALRIYLDTGDLDARHTLVIRRATGAAPQAFGEGQAVAEGPPGPWVDVEPPPPGASPSHYAVFTRSQQAGSAAVSPAVAVAIVDPTPAGIRQFAEGFGSGSGVPPELALLYRALDPTPIAEALLESAHPAVRGWALDHLARRRDAEPVWAEKLLWRALKDQAPALRLRSAAVLLGQQPTALQLRHVVEALGETIEERLQALTALRPFGVAEEILRPLVNELEDRRPTECHECGRELPRSERAAHLMREHDYVQVFGVLWPRGAAMARLWDHVFTEGDPAWAEELARILGQSDTAGEPARRFAAALESEWCRHFNQEPETLPKHKSALVRCLRPSPAWRESFRLLLHSPHPEVREMGRDLLLPEVRANLSGEMATAAEVRQQLERACGSSSIEEKILLCQRLTEAGGVAAGAVACLAQLEQERAIDCPECRAPVVVADLESHLRRAHGLYQFRGVRRTLESTFKALLSCVCSPSPDYSAWKTLIALAEEALPARADAQLAEWLVHKLGDRSEEERPAAALAVAEAAAAGGTGPRLVPHLVRRNGPNEKPIAWHLTLEIVARVPPPVTASLIQAVRPLLASRRLSLGSRCAAVASLLRTTGRDLAAARDVLEAFVERASTKRSLEWLDHLEERTGPVPALEALRGELEGRLRMLCPRCGVEMRRQGMDEHLWNEHRLVREGRRVREPWRLIEDWIDDYRLEKDPLVLARCQELARRAEGEAGLRHLGRLLLNRGIDEPHTRQLLLNEALRKRGSLCPHCFSLIPMPGVPAAAALEIRGGRLEGAGHRVAILSAGLVPRVEAATPLGVVYRGNEPGRSLTRLGRAVALVGTPLALAAILLLTSFLTGGRTLAAAALALGAALLMAGYVCLRWRPETGLVDRAVRQAWAILVPHVLATRPDEESGRGEALAFVAGLARLSIGRAWPIERAEPLRAALERVEEEWHEASNAPQALAELWRLAAEDRGQLGDDPVPPLVAQVSRCLTGDMPLHYAGPLLEKFASPWWSGVGMTRLRLLLFARAFQAGYEVGDLLRASRAFPQLGTALKLDPAALAQLRLVWALRSRRPWERVGKALTVFELAKDREASAWLAEHPDLLLADVENDIYLTGRGLVFQGALFTQMPESIAVQEIREFQDGGFNLLVGTRKFHFPTNPDEVAARLERWLRFHLGEFLPQAVGYQHRRSADVLATLGALNAVVCPECRERCLPQFAEVAVRLDDVPRTSSNLPTFGGAVAKNSD